MESFEIDINNAKQKETRESKLAKAREFSMYDIDFNIPGLKSKEEVRKITDENAYEKMYGMYDRFIDELYLRGLELNDPFFPGTVVEMFMETHQSGFSLKDYLKGQDEEVQNFFKQHGQWFLDNIGIGAETEQYKQWTCKMRERE